MEVERVGALGSLASGVGREFGNTRGGVKGTEGRGETDGPRKVGGKFLMVSCVPATLQGCVEKIGGWLRSKVLVVAAAALGIAFVEVRDTLEHLGSRGSGRVLNRRCWPGEGRPGGVWGLLGGPRVPCFLDSSSPPSLSLLLGAGYRLCLLPCEEHPKWL